MLKESIKNARKAAEKFGNKLGYLKKANQGIFLISPADMEVKEVMNIIIPNLPKEVSVKKYV